MLRAIELSQGSITVNISDVYFVEPAFLVSLAALMQFAIQSYDGEKYLIRPSSEKVKNYMVNMRFDELLMETKYDPQKPIWAVHNKLRQFQSADEKTIADCASALTLSCGYSFTNLYRRIEDTFAELMINVSSHSESPVGGFIHLQHYPRLNRVRFSIADLGITIPKHVTKNPAVADAVRSDEEALAKAVELAVSGNPSRFSGAGLPFVIAQTQQLGGVVRIYSGSAMLVQTEHDLRSRTTPAPYPGTLLTIDWRVS